MKNILKFLIVIIVFSCQNEDNNDIVSSERRSEVMVENNVFKISYNELKEQPNWIEYTVKDFVKVAKKLKIPEERIKNQIRWFKYDTKSTLESKVLYYEMQLEKLEKKQKK